MEIYIENCREYVNGRIETKHIYIHDGRYCAVSSFDKDIKRISGKHLLIAPSFADIHVHLRDPGYSYKETIESGTKAAARGGFTTVCAMPNLNPVPDCIDSLMVQKNIIDESAVIETIPYASITKQQKGKEISDILEMKDLCCGYSDDGFGVQPIDLMEKAMRAINQTKRFLAAHVEDISLLPPAATVHKGIASKRYNQVGMPSETEYIQLQRDIELVKKTGCRYHLCHISTAESVELIRKAKKEGLSITAEVTPHHLALSDRDISEDNGRFKMNPPLRSEEDRLAILEGIADGTIDIIATDHAPHSEEEKSKGLKGSAFGTVGLETAFAVANTFLVKKDIVPLERVIYMMSEAPRQIIDKGILSSFVVLDTETEKTVNTDSFLSMGHSTPFAGMELKGDVLLTVYNEAVVYCDGGLTNG